MSIESQASLSPLDEFRTKTTTFLEEAFIAMVAMTFVGFTMYLSVLPHNVQNTLPILLMMFLGTFTWIVRAKIMQVDAHEIRIYLIQWIVISVFVIIATIFAIVVYPYSNAF